MPTTTSSAPSQGTTCPSSRPRRRTEVAVALLFLLATIAFAAGDFLLETAPALGATLQAVTGLAVLGTGLLLLPVLRPYALRRAQGYLLARVLECAAIVACGVLLVTSGSVVPSYALLVYAFTGVGGLHLTSALLVSGLVPRWMARLGVVGYAALLLGTVLDALGDLQSRAEEILGILHSEQLELPEALTEAYGVSVRSMVAVLTTMVAQTATLEDEVQRCFGQHPDAEIITSQPGLGVVLGARVLAEFGDDKDRFVDAKARRNYAGTSPVTKTSGTRRVVLARYARNRRLGDAVHQQAFAALNGSPGARAFYDHHRARGATHHQALRALSNRLVGILDGCLRHRTTYDETIAWAHRATVAA